MAYSILIHTLQGTTYTYLKGQSLEDANAWASRASTTPVQSTDASGVISWVPLGQILRVSVEAEQGTTS